MPVSTAANVQIEQLSPDATDKDVAKLVALYLLESCRTPYWFSIDHDIGPPGFKECPVHFDWAKKKRVGIKSTTRAHAEAWIILAALAGYTVQRDNGDPLTMSIKRARDRASYANARAHRFKLGLLDDSDDIPF